MTARQRKDIHFIETNRDEQLIADEWLDGYLRLLIRVRREHIERLEAASYPQSSLDDADGTGTVRTPSQ
jgi:hypothetical protein